MPDKYFQLPGRDDLTTGILLDSYKIISSKNYTKENTAILANHAYVIEGVLIRELVGMPGEFSDDQETILDNADFKKLEREMDTQLSLSKRFGGEAEAAAPDANLDPATILMIIEVVTKLIQMLRNRKKK